jgi:anti-sigma factor RsiW
MADHGQMEDAVAAYVLDASGDEAERARVRAHIATCPTCRALVARLSQAVDALPLSTEEVRPPDGLRARILAAAAAAPQGQEPAPAPLRIVPLPDRGRPGAGGRRWRLPVYGGAAAAVAVALVALAAWNIALNGQLNAPLARSSVVGTGNMAGASGTVTASRRQAVLTLTGMPQLPPGEVYEVWLIDGSGRAAPAGVFRPTPAGTAHVGIDQPLNDARVIAVTEESGPEGTAAPTKKPELAGQLTTS